MKITINMTEVAYSIAKKVYNGLFTRTEGKIEISKITGMKTGSAQDYITVFLAMMNGEEYHRTINTYSTKYYLGNIKNDFGIGIFNNALNATEKHTKYYSRLGHGNLTSIENIYKEYIKARRCSHET